ncbi:hypothetical protein D3C72_1278000 [compost metagenome]
MRRLAARPGQKALAKPFKKLLQRRGVPGFGQHRLLLRADVEIHQRHPYLRQATRLAQQVRIHLGLRPVQRAVVGGHPFQLATVGLDFLQLLRIRVKPVGPASHQQIVPLAAKADFCLVPLAAPCAHHAMAFHAFESRGRRGEAQVQIARTGRELAQRAHGNGVAHAVPPPKAPTAELPMGAPPEGISPPRQHTWHTRTAMPCAAQYSSQRIWLSCSLSPGPFTSTSS